MSDNLGPQFLYHGTAMDVEGPRLLPAKEHGKGSYWGDTGHTRDEPSEQHAWAHPSEEKAWEFADDRLSAHIMGGHGIEREPVMRRSRVYALHPNEQQSPGHDSSVPGEIKAPHFDVANRIDIKPGHQGTFPEVNWNAHALDGGMRLPGDEDANHPSNLSVQFGHRAGVHGFNGKDAVTAPLHKQAVDEDNERWISRATAVAGRLKAGGYGEDDPLPGMGPAKIRARADAVRWAVRH